MTQPPNTPRELHSTCSTDPPSHIGLFLVLLESPLCTESSIRKLHEQSQRSLIAASVILGMNGYNCQDEGSSVAGAWGSPIRHTKVKSRSGGESQSDREVPSEATSLNSLYMVQITKQAGLGIGV